MTEDTIFNLVDMRLHVDKCESCPLAHKFDSLSFVPFEIVGDNPKPDVVFVAESPGESERKKGRPLIGKSGSFLREVLSDFTDEYALCNTVCCHPTQRSNRTPETEESEYCSEHIHKFIEQIQPKMVILLGRTAYMAMLPQSYKDIHSSDLKSVTKMQRKPPVEVGGTKFAVAFHPSYLVRNGGRVGDAWEEFSRRLRSLLSSSSSSYVDDLSHDLDFEVVNLDKLPQTLVKYYPYSDIGFDYETRLLKTWDVRNKPLGLGLAVATGERSGQATYIEFDREMTPAEKNLLLRFIQKKKPWVYNAKFEQSLTWSFLGQFVEFNDSMTLCMIDCSTGSLKRNAAKLLGADLWEADNENIRNYFLKVYGLYTILSKAKYEAVVKLMKKGFYKQAIELFEASATKKDKDRFSQKISELFSELEDILSEDEISKGCAAFPYEWSAVPSRIIGEYCCWDSYYTVQLKNKLWPKYKDSYPFYIVQTWLGTILESYSLNWNETVAEDLDEFYLQEAIESLSQLIHLLDIEEEKRLEVVEIMGLVEEVGLLKTMNNLKAIFNPLGNKPEKSVPFWNNYRSDVTELINFYQYLDVETASSSVLPEEINRIISTQTDPGKLIDDINAACKTTEEKSEIKKILDKVSKNLDKVAFVGFADDCVMHNYSAWIKYGGIDMDDKESWPSEFWMLYHLRRFKKVMKSLTTYIRGKVGRSNVSLSVSNDLMQPPKRLLNYNEIADYRKNGLRDGEMWVLDSSFNVCSADTKRWSSSNHVIPWNCELRELYTPRTPTSLIAHYDYSQFEVRVLAGMANESALLKAFEEGADIHKRVASIIWNKPEDEVSASERRYAKGCTFSILYGKGVEAFAEEFMGGDVVAARNFFSDFFSVFSGIDRFVKEQHSTVEKDGYVKTLFGDPLYIYKTHGNAHLRQAQNYPIQSTASSLAAIGIYNLYDNCKKKGSS